MLNFRMDGFLHSTDISIRLHPICKLGTQPERYAKIGVEIWLFLEFEISTRDCKQEVKHRNPAFLEYFCVYTECLKKICNILFVENMVTNTFLEKSIYKWNAERLKFPVAKSELPHKIKFFFVESFFLLHHMFGVGSKLNNY